MKYFCLAVLLLSAGFSGAAAETVMVYVQDAPESGYITEERIENASAIETGIMNVLFEEGHIVFNAGIRLDEGYVPDDLKIRLTRIGGARYLLVVGIGSPDPDSQIPTYLSFHFIDTAEKESLKEGAILLEDLAIETETGALEACDEFGAKVAAMVLETLL